MDKLWDSIIRTIDQNELVRLLGKTVLSLAIFIIFVVLGRLARTSVKRITSRTSNNANLPILLSNLAYVGLIMFAVLSILSIYTGAGLNTLLTLLGLVSLAISLSVQDVLRNFVAGVYLLLEQPFSIGDRIKVRDFQGRIENIEIRTTTIHTDEGVLVYVPNSIVFSEVVTNRTAFRQTLSIVRFSVPANEERTFADICEKVKEIAGKFEPAKISADPPPEVLVDSINAEKTCARLEFWSPVGAPVTTTTELALAISSAMPEAEVTA